MEEGREWEEGDGGTKKGRAGSRKRRVRKGLEGIHARTHTRTHARTYTAHTHAHTHTHIHTHTHTHIHPPVRALESITTVRAKIFNDNIPVLLILQSIHNTTVMYQ